MITGFILIFFAALFNSIMDRTEEPVNFNKSIFYNLNQKFWLKSVSWQYAKKIFGYKLDAWHISKSLMICCLLGLIFVTIPFNPFLYYVVLGLEWNLVFNLFYGKILLK